MIFKSYAFAGMTGNTEAASGLFAKVTETTWDVTGYSIPWIILISLLVAWGFIYYCIRNGAHSVGKVVKYTVFLPVIFLLIMAVKGISMPGAMEGIKSFSFLIFRHFQVPHSGLTPSDRFFTAFQL